MIANERGFTLVEILVSLAIFAVVVVGALGVLGAAGSGGFFEGFPTGFVATRAARDTTAAAVFLQAFQEYAASQPSASLIPNTNYCDGPDCTGSAISSSGLTGYPTPPGQPYQLDWRKLEVTIEQWYWDNTVKRYRCSLPAGATCNFVVPIPPTEYIVHLHTKLTWRFRNVTRTLEVDRFLP